MQDANPVCAFSGGRARSSVLGVRSSASDRLRCRVPGRSQVPGPRHLEPGTGYLSSKNAHGVCKMQDTGCGIGLRGKAEVFKSLQTQEAGCLYGHRVGGQ
jgi:hypothetical protein